MKRLFAFGIGRVTSAILTLIGVSIVIFVAIHSLPGSFDEVMAPQGTPELRKQIRERYKLDQPYVLQYMAWIKAVAQGDLGVSLITQEPVVDEFKGRIQITGLIALTATVIAILIAVPLGVISGFLERYPAASGLIRISGNLTMSVPDFVIGSALLYFLSVNSVKFDLNVSTIASGDLPKIVLSLLIPAIALAPLGIGLILATARNATISIRSTGYILAARARGETTRKIVVYHIVPNIAVAVVTVIAIYSGYLLGGAIIVEQLLSIQGFGRFLVQAVLNRDYPVVQGAVLISAAFFIFMNMSADILYSVIDPRYREQG